MVQQVWQKEGYIIGKNGLIRTCLTLLQMESLKGSLTVPGLKAGEHTVKAVYPGSHNYTNSSDTAKFNVTKYDPSVKVTPKNIKVGDDETITVVETITITIRL